MADENQLVATVCLLDIRYVSIYRSQRVSVIGDYNASDNSTDGDNASQVVDDLAEHCLVMSVEKRLKRFGPRMRIMLLERQALGDHAKEVFMRLVGKLQEEVEKAETREEKKALIEEAGMELDDEELEQVSGGLGNLKNPIVYIGKAL